jgi:hypothetical protein
MISFYTYCGFPDVPLMGKAKELGSAIDRSPDSDFIWNKVEAGFHDYVDDSVIDRTLVSPDDGSTTYYLDDINEYMSSGEAEDIIRDAGYVLKEGVFVREN